MKNTFLIAAALFVTAAANAQTPDSSQHPTKTPDSSQHPAQTPATNQTVLADTSVNSAYIADPQALKGLTTESLRPEHAFPVLGTFNATGSASGTVTITLDSSNKGKVWVEGLPQGRFRALMKKAPATYKIPAQQSENGKAIPEGTLFYNPASKELTIVLGREFNDADPTAFASSNTKQKTKEWRFTGVKSDAAAVPPASQQ